MKPAAFDYIAPNSLEAAVAAIAAANGDGKILAGGQSLMPLLNFRLARPSVIVDLMHIPDMSFIERRGDTVAIGALTRHADLEFSDLIAQELPVMAAAMPHVAHLAIRNRGTIGGSLSHADPAAELPMLAVLLELPGQPVLLGHWSSPLHIASTCQQDVAGPRNVTCG